MTNSPLLGGNVQSLCLEFLQLCLLSSFPEFRTHLNCFEMTQIIQSDWPILRSGDLNSICKVYLSCKVFTIQLGVRAWNPWEPERLLDSAYRCGFQTEKEIHFCPFLGIFICNDFFSPILNSRSFSFRLCF